MAGGGAGELFLYAGAHLGAYYNMDIKGTNMQHSGHIGQHFSN